MDLPPVINNVECVIHDFNTGAEIAVGRCSVKLIEQTDRLRMMRNRFEGYFRAATDGDVENLNSHLIQLMSQGAPAHTLMLDYEDRTYSFTVKFEMGEGTLFAFSGRAEPKIV